jgi:benzoyl-CoA reductase/2-hydroxyglutaryl-CoA dehydratase subunit BcrC/BadD/HgdB
VLPNAFVTKESLPKLGFACAYTPLPLLDAAGFAPWRILPLGDPPDQAGRVLHDNLCPHVKRILDRALAEDLPPLAGIVLMNSCDAMRRLADAWRRARPGDRLAFVDLPVAVDDRAVDYFAAELRVLAGTLAGWSGTPVTDERLAASSRRFDEVADLLARLRQRLADGTLPGGATLLQTLVNEAAASGLERAQELLRPAGNQEEETAPGGRVPVFLFGNVLPDPEVFALFESCGARIVADDLCTGSRLFAPLGPAGSGDPFVHLARGLLQRPPCARTLDPSRPGRLAELIAAAAKASGARGAIGHVLKFCDPYLARLPAVREALREAGLPLLVLEGDCSLRSLGQQRTRIEAFVEMLVVRP